MTMLALQGVPPTLRPWVWMEVSGAAAKKAAVKSSNYFTNMALAGERSPFLKEIDQVCGGMLRCSRVEVVWKQLPLAGTEDLAVFSCHLPARMHNSWDYRLHIPCHCVLYHCKAGLGWH